MTTNEVTLEGEVPDNVGTVQTEVPSMDRELNRNHDRCDRCGAEAYLRAVMPGGGELLFCAHHGTRYLDKLRGVALHVQDERDKVNAKPSVAAY